MRGAEEGRDRVLALYRRYEGMVYSIIRRFESDPTRREDLVQEAWARIIGKLPSKSEASPIGGWIAVVARNVAREGLRGRTAWWRLLDRAERIALLPPSEDPDSGPLGRRAEEALWEAVGDLSGRERQVLLKRALLGYSAVELAASLGCSAATVRWTYHQARSKAAEALPELRELWENDEL